MERSAKTPMPKPPVPKCENMNKIADDMDAFRETQMSVRRTTNEYLSICIIGFGSIDRRDALMRVIAWALEPILLYSAYIKDVSTKEFEAVMITKKLVSAVAVEEWLGLFNMGLCCIQFDSYMQVDMVTCISRIHHNGKHWFGSFKAKTSARVRRDFYKEHMKAVTAKEQQRLLEVTGLTLTTRNMLLLHERVGALQGEVYRLERQIARRSDTSDANAPIENVEQVNPTRNIVVLATRLANREGDLNMTFRRLAPLQVIVPPPPAVTVDLTSMPNSPRNLDNTQEPRGIPVRVRPPPTGNVSLFPVRE